MKSAAFFIGMLALLFFFAVAWIRFDPFFIYGILLALAFLLVAVTGFVYPVLRKKRLREEEEN